MGQAIEVLGSVVVGDVALIDTDRSVTGQDGEAYASAAEASAGSTFPARLAARLFAAEAGIDHVFVLSNSISIRRPDGWENEALTIVEGIIRDFFIVYEANKGDDGGDDGEEGAAAVGAEAGGVDADEAGAPEG